MFSTPFGGVSSRGAGQQLWGGLVQSYTKTIPVAEVVDASFSEKRRDVKIEQGKKKVDKGSKEAAQCEDDAIASPSYIKTS